METVTVPPGETRGKRIEGGTYDEGLLIDISAPGSHYNLDIRGHSPHVKNIGVKGRNSHEGKEQVISIKTTGDAVLENVYGADGCIPGYHNTLVFVGRQTQGTVTFRNINGQNWVDNCVYASAPGHSSKPSGGADIYFEDSYFRNNNTANMRLASGEVRNCVSISDGDVGLKRRQGKFSRCVWHKEEGTVKIIDSDMLASGPHASPAVMSQDDESGRKTVIEDSDLAPSGNQVGKKHSSDEIVMRNVGSDPDLGMPNGVPRTAREAALGDGSDGSKRTEPRGFSHRCVLGGEGSEPRDKSEALHWYAITSGSARLDSDLSEIDRGDETDVAGEHLGMVGGWFLPQFADGFEFEGDLLALFVLDVSNDEAVSVPVEIDSETLDFNGAYYRGGPAGGVTETRPDYEARDEFLAHLSNHSFFSR